MKLQIFVPAGVFALALTGCVGGNGMTAAETEAAVARNAREAIGASMRAIAGRTPTARAHWLNCVQGAAWKYSGDGRFESAAGEEAAQIEAIRKALTAAGFTDATEVENSVVVERPDFRFAISRDRPIAERPWVWRYSFKTDCNSYGRADRARVDATSPYRTIAP